MAMTDDTENLPPIPEPSEDSAPRDAAATEPEPAPTSTATPTEPAPTPTEPAPTSAARRRRPLSWWMCLAIGVGAALVGLLPWLITGMRLPVQDLWATQTPPGAMPIVLLPFSQYATTLLFALIVTGAAAAGIATRATRELQRRGGVLMIALGMLVAQGLALVQTALPVMRGLQHRSLATLYLAALVGVVILSMLIGVIVVVLIGSAPRAGATIGISIAAIAAAIWLGELLHPLLASGGGASGLALTVLRWTPAVLVGIGLAWGGLNTVGRILALPLCLAILWVGPAAVTAIDNAAGSRVLAHQPSELLRYAIAVFFAAVSTPSIVIPPLAVALAIGVVGAVVMVFWRRSRAKDRTAAETAGEADAAELEAAPDAAPDAPDLDSVTDADETAVIAAEVPPLRRDRSGRG